jgi:hypothetical protein
VAYNSNYKPENPLAAKGRSILTQVAFKEAVVSAQRDGIAIESDEFLSRFTFLNGALIAEVEAQVALAPKDAAEAAPKSNFTPRQQTGGGNGRTPSGAADGEVEGLDGYMLEVKKQQGPVPSWLVEQAAAAGVRSVWDNRQDAQGTNKPWFRAADGTKNSKGQDVAFWPPRD